MEHASDLLQQLHNAQNPLEELEAHLALMSHWLNTDMYQAHAYAGKAFELLLADDFDVMLLKDYISLCRSLARAFKQQNCYLEALNCHERIAEVAGLMQENLTLELQSSRAERTRLRAKVRQLSQENAQLSEALNKQLRLDPLVGIPNRKYAEEFLQTALENARDLGEPLTVVIADIDHFKAINEEYGLTVSNDILKTLGGLLKEQCRRDDFVARFGGEEFVLVHSGLSPFEAYEVCERLRKTCAEYTWHEIHPNLQVNLSFGFAHHVNATSIKVLLEEAENAVQNAKLRGRNCVSPTRAELKKRLN